MIGVGVAELAGRPHRPFLETQLAVMVGVEPGEGVAAGIIELLERDAPIVVAVGAVEAALLAGALIRGRRRRRRDGSPAAAAARLAGGAPGNGSSSSWAMPFQMKNPARTSSRADPAPAKYRHMRASLDTEANAPGKKHKWRPSGR